MTLQDKSQVLKLMIVEDYDSTRELVAMALDGEPYELTLCRNGTDALHKFLDSYRCDPHAGILMDLALPDINGMRVMRAIREIEKGSHTGCVPIRFGLATAQSESIDGTSALDSLGVTLHLDKPFFPRDPDPFTRLRMSISEWIHAAPPALYDSGSLNGAHILQAAQAAQAH